MNLIKFLIFMIGISIISCEFKDTLLKQHNDLRSKYKVSDLEWDDKLASASLNWSREMAVKNKFNHDSNRGKGIGENIALYGSSNNETASLPKLFSIWSRESEYTDLSKPVTKCCVGNPECLHFTQIVWGKTKKVGCGIASDSKNFKKYLTCRYSPAGNVLGEKAIT